MRVIPLTEKEEGQLESRESHSWIAPPGDLHARRRGHQIAEKEGFHEQQRDHDLSSALGL